MNRPSGSVAVITGGGIGFGCPCTIGTSEGIGWASLWLAPGDARFATGAKILIHSSLGAW